MKPSKVVLHLRYTEMLRYWGLVHHTKCDELKLRYIRGNLNSEQLKSRVADEYAMYGPRIERLRNLINGDITAAEAIHSDFMNWGRRHGIGTTQILDSYLLTGDPDDDNRILNMGALEKTAKLLELL